MFRLVNRRRSTMGACGVGLASAIMMMLALGVPSTMATPGGAFAAFAQCPLDTPALNGCIAIRAESGEITIGKLKMPIDKPQTLQGGLLENQETPGVIFVAAANGETMPRTPQAVPAGSVQCEKPRGGRRPEEGRRWFDRGEHGLCKAIFENDRAGLYATPELAAPASSIGLDLGAALTEQGIALSLPVKLKLENPLLGNQCYIGSDSKPVVIDFTDGPAGELTGKLGQVEFTSEGIEIIKGVTFVNDTFAAPEATGCGHHGRLDPLINAKLGLPAPAGANSAVLEGTHEQAGANNVAEHEEPAITNP